MWHDLLTALALVMVIEGIMPFMNPDAMRRVLLRVVEMDSRSLRISGFFSMVFGVTMLYLVN